MNSQGMSLQAASRPPRVLGLMSGTSADGIDAVLLELPGWPALGSGVAFPALPGGAPRGRVVEHQFMAFTPELRQEVLRAIHAQANTTELTQLHWALGEALAAAARPLARHADLIASHGQTVQHHPQPQPGRGWVRPATLQLGEAALIAERCGVNVIADFRPADMAAGGVGAPLVPFADYALFAQEGINRVLLNIGGLANITYLPGVNQEKVMAFDTGPGNCLLDEVAALVGQEYDQGGKLAATGTPDPELLSRWLAHPELKAPPPKATGREVWSFTQLGQPELPVPVLAATAAALTARTVADALRFLPDVPDEVIVAGGGAKNPTLVRELRRALGNVSLKTFADLGWDQAGFTDMTREAAAFAFLGYARAQGWANTLPATTGARHAVSAGKLIPAPFPFPRETPHTLENA